MNLIINYVAALFAVSMLSLSLFSDETAALKLTKLIVPELVLWKTQTTLECRYMLASDEKLYRVQWYKDNDEFYRYDQKSEPRKLTYSIDQIEVDKLHSNENQVVLKNVNLMMRGVYRCEVSAEQRSFITVEGEARMEVIAMPIEDPLIQGEESFYQIGDAINLTCTSGKSFPPTTLRWFINNQEISSTDNSKDTVENGLVISKTSLSLIARPEHFIDSHIRIKCQATISVGNHSVVMPPLHHNKNSALSFSKIGYHKDALISAKGSGVKILANVFSSLAPASLLYYFLFYDVT